MSFGWDSVNRDGYNNQKARRPKRGGGKKKGCGLVLIAFLGAGLALGKAIAESLS